MYTYGVLYTVLGITFENDYKRSGKVQMMFVEFKYLAYEQRVKCLRHFNLVTSDYGVYD